MPLNSNNFHQICKFGIIFDTRPCEIDDLAVSSHQRGMRVCMSPHGNICVRHMVRIISVKQPFSRHKLTKGFTEYLLVKIFMIFLCGTIFLFFLCT